ncbi:hypothetical protein QJQ45_028431 [Haematococcus lacustris]|nr:hypothetical protein QJQ45_028431 [Haematococcus lacustris]
MRRSYISNAPQMEECYSHKRMQVQSNFQSSLDVAWPSCCGVAGSCQQESLQPRDSLPAEYVSMDYRVPVSIPCWWCTDCEQHVMPDFTLAGCFPSSPQRPSLLFSLTLMKALTVFQSGRLSMTVFASGIHAAHRPYELFLDPTDQPIKAELLTEAHCNWLRATTRVTHLDNLLPGVELSGGPFADCPCCAGMSVGPPVSIHGLIGFCCSHGVPLLGMFCNMRTPEQFAYYLLALAILMNFCTEFYIDFGCRLKADYVELELQRRVWLVMTGQEADATSLQLTPTMMGLLHNKGWQQKTFHARLTTLELRRHISAEEGLGMEDTHHGLELLKARRIAGHQLVDEAVINSMVAGAVAPWALDPSSPGGATLLYGKRFFRCYGAFVVS